MRRLFCILSGLSLALFIFSLSPDVYALKGFKTEVIKSQSYRSYGRSLSKDSGGATQGAAVDEEEKVTLTISPVTAPLTQSPAEIPDLGLVENQILVNLAAAEPLSVQQGDGQGYVSIGGNLAVWLSDFLYGNPQPALSLNSNRERLYIPEFFRATLAICIHALPASQDSPGTLVWIEVEVPSPGAEVPAVNHQMTIHYHINPDDDVQMNLYMGHINDITGYAVIATTTLSDNIDTSDPLRNKRFERMVRRDSLTRTNVIIGNGNAKSLGNFNKEKKFAGMGSIKERSGEGKQYNVATMAELLVANKTLTELQIKEQHQAMDYEKDDWSFELEGVLKTLKSME